MSEPCAACPWLSQEARDKASLSPEVRAAAEAGSWFCCHVQLGECEGARRYGEAKRRQAQRAAAAK